MKSLYLRLFIVLFALTPIFVIPGTLASKAEQVELQPFAAQVKRLLETLDFLGAPLSATDREALDKALAESDQARAIGSIQNVLDKYCLVEVQISPESRVKVMPGKGKTELLEKGWRTFLIKVRNEAGVTAELKVESPNALPVFGAPSGSPRPERSISKLEVADRWLDLSLFTKPPFKPQLSGLGLEYRIIQLYSRDAGKREARLGFNVGQGTQDIGFRNDTEILFNCLPSADVTLR
ncbi:MAG: hypothetical protein J2P41_18755, partial [Blastocatellia bacterium]|nr:hypothetical protein [Blastocatellia bacterium]